MQERLAGVYDAMIIAHDTRKNLEDNKHALAPFELVISTDSGDLLYKDERGNISGFFGATGDINEQIKKQVDENTKNVSENTATITSHSQAIGELVTGVSTKLERGQFTGTADDLNRNILINTSSLSSKLDKGSFNGNADNLVPQAQIDGVKIQSRHISSMGLGDNPTVVQVIESLQDSTIANIIVDSNHTNICPVGGIGGALEIIRINPYRVILRFTVDTQARNFEGTYHANSGWTGWFEVFNTSNCPRSGGKNEWSRLPNGMIIQRGSGYAEYLGTVFAGQNFPVNIGFPISFSDTNYSFVYTAHGEFAHIVNAGHNNHINNRPEGTTFHVFNPTTSDKRLVCYDWIAIGY